MNVKKEYQYEFALTQSEMTAIEDEVVNLQNAKALPAKSTLVQLVKLLQAV